MLLTSICLFHSNYHGIASPTPRAPAVCVTAALSPACSNATFELACDKSAGTGSGGSGAPSEADTLLGGASPLPVASVAASASAALFAALKPDAEWLTGAALD
jgi:hypothetical protein